MKNGIATLFTLLAGGALLAAPKLEPVAGGYPNWQGLSAKSFIAGRKIQPSDLRHKATIVVEVDAGEKVQSQLTQAAPLIADLNYHIAMHCLSKLALGALYCNNVTLCNCYCNTCGDDDRFSTYS